MDGGIGNEAGEEEEEEDDEHGTAPVHMRSSTRNESDFKLDERELDVTDVVTPSAPNLTIMDTIKEQQKNDDDDHNNDENVSVTATTSRDVDDQNKTAAAGATATRSPAGSGSGDEDEDDELTPILDDINWRTKDKHLFILSEAGKPIYTLHGNEVQLMSFMGLLQALVSIIECDNDNRLYHMLAGGHKFVFLHRAHLIFVIVSAEADTCVEHLRLQLSYAYNQVVSVCTLSLIDKIFTRHHNYDLRNKLSGTEKLLGNIVRRFDAGDYGMMLGCINSYPLVSEVREQVSRLIAQQVQPIKYVLFALLLFDARIIALIRPKTKNIHPLDVHLLVNVVTGLDTPKSAEFTWYPICLPNFDPNGIMYAYISRMDESCRTYLILLTGLCNHEQSHELNECRKRIQARLNDINLIAAMNARLSSGQRDMSLSIEQLGVADLKHFLFKDNKLYQYFASDFAAPYAANDEWQLRVFRIYQSLYHKLHNATNTLRIVYFQRSCETVLGWMTSNFEIYATFSPLITKDVAIKAVNKLLEFTQKNKAKIFIQAMPTLQR